MQEGTTLGIPKGRQMRGLGPAGAEPCEAGGRAFRAERNPVPTRGRDSTREAGYLALSAARLCLLVFSR